MTSIRLDSLDHKELVSKRTGEPFAFSAVVSEILGVSSLFIHHDVIPPGRRASGRHFHTERDEVVVVLEGAVSYDRGGARSVARAGEAIGFPRGEAYAHAIENHTDEPATILVIANAAAGDVTVHVERPETLGGASLRLLPAKKKLAAKSRKRVARAAQR